MTQRNETRPEADGISVSPHLLLALSLVASFAASVTARADSCDDLARARSESALAEADVQGEAMSPEDRRETIRAALDELTRVETQAICPEPTCQ